MDLHSLIVVVAIVAILPAVELVERWILPRFLPSSKQSWTSRDSRKALLIALTGMTVGSVYILAVLALAFR